MNNDGRNYLKTLAIIVVVLIAGAAAWHWGRPAYERLKEHRHEAEAQAFFEKGDYRNALMSARLTLMLDSNNVPACRIMADVAALSHSPIALDWRQKIVELDPTVDNKLALASTALQFQRPPFPLTTEILGELGGTATNLATYQSVATALALRINDLADAERHLEIAERLEPTNRNFQLNIAVLHLNSTNPAVVNAARATLEGFRNDTNLAPAALRSLVSERILRGDLAAARDYSTQLLAIAGANLGDHLQYLGLLQKLHSPDLTARLKSLQHDVATNATLTAQTASWMESNGMLEEAAAWLNSLSTNIQSRPPVQLALANYYLDTTNWSGLCGLTAKGDWGEMNFLRLAYLSRAWEELGEPLVADSQWRSAMDQAGEHLGALNALLELADRWNRKIARENLLNRIVQRYPDAIWAQHQLEELYLADGDTPKLYDFYAGQLSRQPKNLAFKNNLAATALLLKTNLAQADQWAADIYAQHPGDPVIISTYAYAMYLEGRDHDGLAAFQKLSATQLEQPSVALYYGVLLAATGDQAKAVHYLAIAEKGGNLLPEEKKLLAQAEGQSRNWESRKQKHSQMLKI